LVKAFRPAGNSKHKASTKRGKSHRSGKSFSSSSPSASHGTSPSVIENIHIDALDHEGVGVARGHSPVAFVSGALPGETCNVQISEAKKNFVKGHAIAIQQSHGARQAAFCSYFGKCGGCQTQYLDHHKMLDMKQQAVTGLLTKFAVFADLAQTQAIESAWQPALSGSGTGYRRKTRLAVDFRRSNDLRLGFRAQGSSEVISVHECAVLQPELNGLLTPLQNLVTELQNPGGIGHIELLIGDDVQADPDANSNVTEPQNTQPLVIIRTTKTLPVADKNRLAEFAQQQHCGLALEIHQGEYEILSGEAAQIYYHLLDGNKLRALPNDFVQVNPEINRSMIAQAMQWLTVQPQDKVLDLFSGIGNFSLSLAKVADQVIGLEGVPEMVQRAKHNAQLNNIDNAGFYCQDLALPDALAIWRKKGINKVLLDPARGGAKALMPQIMELNPEKVLYVSCNPATFGRDIAALCGGNAPNRETANKNATDRQVAIKHLAGKTLKQAKPKAGVSYKLEKIALLDMFPYTAHTELMALFVRQ